MRVLLKWCLSGLLAVAALGWLLFVSTDPQEATKLVPISGQSLQSPLPPGTGARPTISEGPALQPTLLQQSPYTSTTPAEINAAKARGEAWTEKYRVSDTWTIQLQESVSPERIAEALGVDYLESVTGFPDIHVFRLKGSNKTEIAQQWHARLTQRDDVSWFEQEVIETFALRYDETPPAFSDPLLTDQWHLKNVGDRWNNAGEDGNIYPAWNEGFSGAGIHIAIIDTGTEGNHPDLASNYRDDLDFDYLDNDSSASPENSDEAHGTSVAGVAAAAVNDSCGVGVAYHAEIVGVRLINENQGVSSGRQASAISHRSDIVQIFNNSWGPNTDDGARMAGPATLAFSAMKKTIEEGRGGLGGIYVWAAGNGLAIDNNINYDGWAAHRYSIAVGSTGDHGKRSRYANPGAPMLVCAHSNGDTSGIRTTDLAGSAGADATDCRIDFGGTSSAAPLVAGVVALMLEANPELTWRDVQHILAKTAVKVATVDPDWTRNGAGFWVNHYFGFGRVDAAAAVQVARDWMPVGPETLLNSEPIEINQSIPDNSSAGIQAFHSESQDIRVEHVAVTLDVDAVQDDTADWGDLSITLTSPAGTESILAEPHTDAQKTYDQWTYWTVRNWDETSQGTWKLDVKDRRSGNTHVVKSWKIEIYGTEILSEDNHAPIATGDAFVITEATTLLDVVANDTDEDGDALQVISVYRSPNSVARLLPSGQIEYTFGPGLNGRDRFGYTIHDGRGGIKTAEVRLNIPIPEAIDDQIATTKNTPVTIAVLNNDSDPDDDNFRIKDFGPAQHGQVELIGLFSLKYTPDKEFLGTDRFTYTITDDKDGNNSAEVTIVVAEEGDYALSFDGINDRIHLKNTETLHLTNPFTIEAWIRPTGWGEGETGYGRIFDKGSVIFYLHGTGFSDYKPESLLISLDQKDGNQVVYNTPAHTIKLNQWQHVAVSFDNSSRVRLYINGQEQNLSIPFGAISGPVSSNNQDMIIGEASSNRRAFKGAIDEFRLWNRELLATQISDRMSKPLTGDEEGLLIYLPMNEGNGSLTTDFGSPEQNGDIVEAKWIRGILSANTPPVSSADEFHGSAGEKLIIPVLRNDEDSDGDNLRVSRITHVSHGMAAFQDGSIIFQPEAGFTGLVKIDYEIDDFYNGSASSTLIIAVGEGLHYSAWESRYFAGDLGALDEDFDLDSLNNFTEYAFGTDPRSARHQTNLRNIRYFPVSGRTLFTYTLLKESLDVSYTLKKSMDMKTWTTATEGEDYNLIFVREAGPETETRLIEFLPEEGGQVFVKLEAFSLADTE